MSQDLAAEKCRAWLMMGCGLARSRGILSVGLLTGKRARFAEDGWDQMIEDTGRQRRSLEVSSCSQWELWRVLVQGGTELEKTPPPSEVCDWGDGWEGI